MDFPGALTVICNIFSIGKSSFSAPKKQVFGDFFKKQDSHKLGTTFIHFSLLFNSKIYLYLKHSVTLLYPFLFLMKSDVF